MMRAFSKVGARRTFVIAAVAVLIAGLVSACASGKSSSSGAASTVSGSVSTAASGDVVAQVQAVLAKASEPSVLELEPLK